MAATIAVVPSAPVAGSESVVEIADVVRTGDTEDDVGGVPWSTTIEVVVVGSTLTVVVVGWSGSVDGGTSVVGGGIVDPTVVVGSIGHSGGR